MSADQTEALVRRYYEAFNRGDVEAMLACLSEGVVHDVNQGVRRTGKAAFRAFCGHMARCYVEELKNVVVMVSADGRPVPFTEVEDLPAPNAGPPPPRRLAAGRAGTRGGSAPARHARPAPRRRGS